MAVTAESLGKGNTPSFSRWRSKEIPTPFIGKTGVSSHTLETGLPYLLTAHSLRPEISLAYLRLYVRFHSRYHS